jgi:transaldolase
MKRVDELAIEIFADGADKKSMLEMYKNKFVKGFTTNPSLMRKAGVTDYRAFAKDIVAAIPDRSLSFEVFADDFPGMERQAREITTWGKNVYVKIPISNTKRESSVPLIRKLSSEGIKLNITAMMTLRQVYDVAEALIGGAPAYVSVFAGRIADTGIDPVPLMASAVHILTAAPQSKLLWASPRELLNVFQADAIGCQVITATPDIINKLALVGKDLDGYSLETVKMFHQDATSAGFAI